MSRRVRTRGLALNAEINVVSLIDVILLLLLIFMITAPMMSGGIDLRLPTATVQQIESKDAVMIEIDSVGKLFVDGKPWTLEQLTNTIKAHLRGRDQVTFRGDERVMYGIPMKVWSILYNAGVRDFGLMAIPENPKGR